MKFAHSENELLTLFIKVVCLMKHSILNHFSTARQRMYDDKGFTLLELLTVIVVCGILLAVAIPNFETMAYGPSADRATLELVGALQQARLKAIATNQPVTVTFNQPEANQLTTTWTKDGNDLSRIHRLSSNTARVNFDDDPPGEVPAPDDSFLFTNMGFIEPSLGNTTGNIYVVDNTNDRRFHIATTLAGGIVERNWNGTQWVGPILSYTP
jgi:prepilin-type N-terminal cleavage/methylation domain-containing protein